MQSDISVSISITNKFSRCVFMVCKKDSIPSPVLQDIQQMDVPYQLNKKRKTIALSYTSKTIVVVIVL